MPKPIVFYVDSYHEGNSTSDDILAGIRDVLRPSNVHLRVFFMDAKRHSEPELIEQRVDLAMMEIKQYEPVVVITSGNTAVKHIVSDNLRNSSMPCVFCGIDWSCDRFGLPAKNVTGILEIPPIEYSIKTIKKYYPNAKRLIVIAGSSMSEQESKEITTAAYVRLGLIVTLVRVETYEQWKEIFVEANNASDLIFLSTNDGIIGWDNEDAKVFVKSQIRVPVIACKDSMMPYAVLGVTAVSQEQGRWAAKAALRIIGWKKPKDIPIAKSCEARIRLNQNLAAKISFIPDEELFRELLPVE